MSWCRNSSPTRLFIQHLIRINKEKKKTNALQWPCMRGTLVLKDHTSNYKNLLLKSGFDSFRIYAVKSLVIELCKILEGMTPNYLSELFGKADTPYDTRDKFKLIQPLKRTTTYDLRSFQYYGAHVWNMLPVNIKAAQSLREFKSLIRSWPGPTCSCQLCVALLW